jgi:hypothetical protein
MRCSQVKQILAIRHFGTGLLGINCPEEIQEEEMKEKKYILTGCL